MIFNSQICTAREQSERLIALGLKKETADMKYLGTSEYYGGVLTEGISRLPLIIDTEDDDITEYDIPAWSLHRLLMMTTNKRKVMLIRCESDLYDVVIKKIECEIKEGIFNKEYLERKE